MATIRYQFADGHFEDIEVTEEFKREYEFLEIQERARYWKIKKQKQRADLEVKYDLSLDRLCDDGQEPPACALSPLGAEKNFEKFFEIPPILMLFCPPV